MPQSTTRALGAVGPYQLQAAINSLHDDARRAEDTDWPQIAGLYALLARMQPSPGVELNRARRHLQRRIDELEAS